MPTDDANPWDDPGATDAPATDPTPATDDAVTGPDLGKAAPAPAPSAQESARADPVADDIEPDEPSPEDRRRVLVIAAVAFVLIAVVAFALTRGGGDDDDEPVTGGDGAPTSQTEGDEGAGGTITIAGTTDDFGRDDTDDGLGTLPSGAEWVVQSGGWAVQGGEAVVARPDAEKRNTVFVATGYPDPQAQVRMTAIANNAGMVFRYQGECNYWAVYAVPEFATWNVEKVVDCARVGEGDSQVYRTINQAPVADGTTVGVVLSGEQVQIVLNGRIALTFDDPDLAGAGKVGLTTKGPAEVHFDDFVGGGPGGQGIVGANTPAPGEGTTTAPAGGGATTAPAGGGATTAPTATDPEASEGEGAGG